MDQPELPLDEQVRRIRKDVVELADKLKVSPLEALALLAHRELVIANQQLRWIHETLDFMTVKKKGEGGANR